MRAVNAPRRTNQTFRDTVQKSHHVEETLLLKLPIDLVTALPLEYMHLVCLGVVRKLIYLWTKGKKCPGRLSRASLDKLSFRLIYTKNYTPSEFSRRHRSLKEIDNWKATELRQFLFYTGPVILEGILTKAQYVHFLSLSVASPVLQNKKLYLTYNAYASDLLKYFVKCFGKLYGNQYISYNVHGLIHVAEDCKQHGILEDYSGFKFENHLQHLKKLVRAPRLPLQQVHNRIKEIEATQLTSHPQYLKGFKRDWKSDFTACFSDGVHYRVFITDSYTLKLTSGNNCFQLKNGDIAIAKSFLQSKDKNFVFFCRQGRLFS